MPGSEPPPEPRDGEGARLDDLMAAVETVRAELRELRDSLADEVRTRKVILAESDGFERLVAAARDGFAHVTLHGRTVDGQATCVELFANDPINGTGTHIGVALTTSGEVVAAFETIQGDRPRIWLAPDDDRSPD